MSLFGGDAAYEPELTPESSFPASSAFAASSPPAIQISEDDAKVTQVVSYTTYDADNDSDDDDESESDMDVSMYEASRPNRFIGKRTTWQGYTAIDRGIAASLDEMQAADLAAHLYNAHALKQRMRLPGAELTSIKSWKTKDLWLKKGAALIFADITGQDHNALVPFKRWTAWPLPETEVSLPGDRSNWPGTDEMTAASGAHEAAAYDLKEEILALLLREAKERTRARESADDIPDNDDGPPNARSRSRSKTVKSQPASSRAASHVGESDNDVDKGIESKTDGETAENNDSESKWAHILQAEKQTRRLRPNVLADDDYARRILQPPINSLLAHVDRLAAGVRRARMNHFGRGPSNDTSGSEGPSDGGSDRSSSRSLSRSRSRSASAKPPTSRSSSRAPSVKKRARSVKPPKGRKRQRPHDDSNPASDDSLEPGSDTSRSRRDDSVSSDASNASDTSSNSNNGEASVQIGLMDWSEILGVASMTGWDQGAIARTAQRCAALFGEGVSFRPFEEGLADKPVAESIPYTPATIPGRDIQDTRSTATKRPFFESGTLRCPHTDCPYHNEDLRIPYRVVEHVKRAHGYDPRTNDSDNEDRKHGGVHIDGYLQTISAKAGWLGGGRSKSNTPAPIRSIRSKSKTAKEESTPAPDSFPTSPT